MSNSVINLLFYTITYFTFHLKKKLYWLFDNDLVLLMEKEQYLYMWNILFRAIQFLMIYFLFYFSNKTGNRLQGLIVEKDKSLNLRGMWCNPIEMR